MSHDRGQTTYGQLLDIATQDLHCATARQHHPARQAHPSQHTPHLLGVLADALAQLGGTLSAGRHAHRDLQRNLRLLADQLHRHSAPPPPETELRGIELDLVDAAVALRTATDLIDSTGPLPDYYTPRLQDHSRWTRPRPEALHDPAALDAGWTQIADLSLTLTGLAEHAELPPVRGFAPALRAITATAHAIPRPPGEHLPLQRATPGWPLPLPRHAVPNEWDGRLAELSAMAWRITLPPRPGQPHPIGVLRGIALIGAELHHRAAQQPDTPPDVAPTLEARAQHWTRIAVCTASVHTPTAPLPVDQRFSLLRTRDLALRGELDLADLNSGQTTLALAASYSSAALEHFTGHSEVTIGPRIATELRKGRPDLALAALNSRSLRVAPGALDPLAELYTAATQPLGQVNVHAPAYSNRRERGLQVVTSQSPTGQSPSRSRHR